MVVCFRPCTFCLTVECLFMPFCYSQLFFLLFNVSGMGAGADAAALLSPAAAATVAALPPCVVAATACHRGGSPAPAHPRACVCLAARAIDGGGCCSAREDENRRKKTMTYWAHASVRRRGPAVDRQPRAFESVREYTSSYTSTAGPKSSPHVFYNIFAFK
jgi:hypothetical protein